MEIVSIIVSVVTACAAIIALYFSSRQIAVSNRQSLFDRRLKIYLLVKRMKSLYDQNKGLIKSYLVDIEKGPIPTLDFLFNMMTNNAYLEELQGLLEHTLESEPQYKYLLKIEEMRNISEETKLIFSKKIGGVLSDYIFNYGEMLASMYRYQVAIKGIAKENQPLPEDNSLEKEQRSIFEKQLTMVRDLSNKIDDQKILIKTAKKIKLK